MFLPTLRYVRTSNRDQTRSVKENPHLVFLDLLSGQVVQDLHQSRDQRSFPPRLAKSRKVSVADPDVPDQLPLRVVLRLRRMRKPIRAPLVAVLDHPVRPQIITGIQRHDQTGIVRRLDLEAVAMLPLAIEMRVVSFEQGFNHLARSPLRSALRSLARSTPARPTAMNRAAGRSHAPRAAGLAAPGAPAWLMQTGHRPGAGPVIVDPPRRDHIVQSPAITDVPQPGQPPTGMSAAITPAHPRAGHPECAWPPTPATSRCRPDTSGSHPECRQSLRETARSRRARAGISPNPASPPRRGV